MSGVLPVPIDPVTTALNAGAAYTDDQGRRIFLMSAYELQKFVMLVSAQLQGAVQHSDIVPNR
jgi:hypothetical protein